MFSFSKKNDIFCPVGGSLMVIDKVKDEVFSKKLLGDGFAINPSNGDIFSPLKATITSIFPTKHAIGLTTNKGIECLVHMGIDTVELGGEPFTIFTRVGDQVNKKSKLACIDLKYLEERNIDNTIIVVFTNSADKINELNLLEERPFSAGECIGNFN